MEGNNKLVATLKGLKSVTELNGDTITHVSAMAARTAAGRAPAGARPYKASSGAGGQS